MDQTEALEIAYKYAEAVSEKYSFNKFILFGSYAKGNSHADSDIDIAVVFDDFDNRIERQVELMRLTHNIDSRIEPHPFRERDFEISNPLAFEIMEFGIEIKRETV